MLKVELLILLLYLQMPLFTTSDMHGDVKPIQAHSIQSMLKVHDLLGEDQRTEMKLNPLVLKQVAGRTVNVPDSPLSSSTIASLYETKPTEFSKIISHKRQLSTPPSSTSFEIGLKKGKIISSTAVISLSKTPAGIRGKQKPKTKAALTKNANTTATQTITNVVEEVPTLDVGPLVLLRVSDGSVARLPCALDKLPKNDDVRLVLWYRNDTTRPFLSYDAREKSKPRWSEIFARSKDAFQRRDFVLFYRMRWLESEPRIALGRGGETLVLRNVRKSDQAEYRCTVHYRNIASLTNRVQLLVTDSIANVDILGAQKEVIPVDYGPFTEGSEISLLCNGHCTGRIHSLIWMYEGEPIRTTWKTDSSASGVSTLHMQLEKVHAEGTITCRLRCQHERSTKIVETSIFDTFVNVKMLYVPQARLFIDVVKSKAALTESEGHKGGANIQVLEGEVLTFICLIRANPHPYNITWLVNGQVLDVTGSRWTRENHSLTIESIRREDFGLYTCLASNSVGDGQSNAINIRVAYPPYCKRQHTKHVITGKNTTLILECSIEAFPSNVTFSWRRVNLPPLESSRPFNLDPLDGTVINDHAKYPDQPKLIELSPEDSSRGYADVSGHYPMPQGPPLPHFEDPKLPMRSLFTLVPDADDIGIICLSRNRIGRTRSPCLYRISVVDSPDPPIGCHINSVSVSTLSVECKLRASKEDQLPSKQTPGLSPVRSPGIKGSSILEVWSMGTLIANQSSERGIWNVHDLPPDTEFRLRIYSLSTHTISEPVVLFAHTLSEDEASFERSHGINPISAMYPTARPSQATTDDEPFLLFLIGGIIAGVVVILAIILSALLIARAIQRRTGVISQEEQECTTGEDDPWAGPSFVQTYETIASSPL